MFLLLTVTHKNSILCANNKQCTLNDHTAKELQGVFFFLLLQEVNVSFYTNRSKICADESAHAASLGKISSGSWSPLEQFPLCVWTLEWRPFFQLLQEVNVSFYNNRSKICADESAHAASLGKISSGSWSPLEQFPLCVWRLQWRPFKLFTWNTKYSKPG